MWTKFFFLLLLSECFAGLFAQPGAPSLIYVSIDPSGACVNSSPNEYNYTNGNFWGCLNSQWTIVSGSGSGGGGGGGTNPNYPPNQLLQGCGVEYVSALTFTVGTCTYTINNITYNSPLTTITLSAADPTNPRIDAIIVNTSNVVTNVTGTPAASPATPALDPTSQLLIINVYVAANGTTPQGIGTTLLYDENTEWTCSGSATFNCASTNNPYHGSKDIEATAAALSDNVTLVKPAAGTVDLGLFNTVVFYIRTKAAWPTGNSGANAARRISIFWKNGSTVKGNTVILQNGVFGFNSATTNAYQQISIPTSLFNINGVSVTTLEFQISGNTGTSTIGFYLDEVSLQSGQNTSTPQSQTRTCIIDNDTQSATALVAANFSGTCGPIPSVAGFTGATIVEVDVIGGTGLVGARSITGTSSINLQRYTPNGGGTATILSGPLATVSGYACAMPTISTICSTNKISSGAVTISTTALSFGDYIQTSAAAADAAQTWYSISVTYQFHQ